MVVSRRPWPSLMPIPAVSSSSPPPQPSDANQQQQSFTGRLRKLIAVVLCLAFFSIVTFKTSLNSTAYIPTALTHFVSVSRAPSPPPTNGYANHDHLLCTATNTCARKCHIIAMIAATATDMKNGIANTIEQNFPTNTPSAVCCAFIFRSHNASYYHTLRENGCDYLYVPMVRPDTWATISEKLRAAMHAITLHYDFDWLQKMDTDTFLCPARMQTLLRNFDPAGVVYLGNPLGWNDIMLAKPREKYYNPSLADIHKHSYDLALSKSRNYHPYMSGAGYTLSRGAMVRLAPRMLDLRYGVMEDSMVGSWLLSLSAHRVFVPTFISFESCELGARYIIAHPRRGVANLKSCFQLNTHCRIPYPAQVSTGRRNGNTSRRASADGDAEINNFADVRDIAFVIVTNSSSRLLQVMDAYESVRSAFPHNHVLIGDVANQSTLTNISTVFNDDAVTIVTRPGAPRGPIRNELVRRTVAPFVCLLDDQARLSWETFMHTMQHAVHSGLVDIATGFLTINPHQARSRHIRFMHGVRLRVRAGRMWKMGVPRPVWNGRENDGDIMVVQTDGTTGFFVARRELLVGLPWGDFGPLTEDVWHLQLRARGVTIGVVDSGARYGFHYPLLRDDVDCVQCHTRNKGLLVREACEALASLNISRVDDGRYLLNCKKQQFLMWHPSGFNVTW